MLTDVGAPASTEIFKFGQTVVFVEVAVVQLRPVIVTAYGFGFWMLKKTGPAGPPGYSDAPAPAGVTGVTTRLCATVAAPAPLPDPDADQTAYAIPAVSPSTTTALAVVIKNRLPLISYRLPRLNGVNPFRTDLADQLEPQACSRRGLHGVWIHLRSGSSVRAQLYDPATAGA
jgi:nitrate reductase NapE component